MSAATKWKFGDQEFDPRFDFFLCPTHGLIVPHRFSADWDSDCGCPVPTYDEESCDERLTAVFLDNLVPEARLREVEAERDAAIKEADRLKADHQGGRGELEKFRERKDDCGVCGVPGTNRREVCEGYSVPRCDDHRDLPAYQAESRLDTLLSAQPPAPRGLSEGERPEQGEAAHEGIVPPGADEGIIPRRGGAQ